ncbi:hypothetical protein GCM10011608_61730 [Micromonospora sonchi]|uniref:Uncharacterized protein n=1 Tax=Micromonospora sonchi TaxID=1763543 RepID=A0A917X547_9ACTN|nr:hypothetical protein GCM10011608_61730 [Micromonospora sonchi]
MRGYGATCRSVALGVIAAVGSVVRPALFEEVPGGFLAGVDVRAAVEGLPGAVRKDSGGAGWVGGA